MSAKQPTLDEAICAFAEEAVHNRASVRTQETYRDAVRRFFVAAELTTLDEAKALTEQQVPKVLRQLERKYRPATVAMTISATRQFYRALRVDESDLVNPLTGDIRIPVPDNVPEWNVLQEGGPEALLAQAESPRDRAVLLCLVMQGWRVSEFCKMTWRNVREQGGKHVAQWRGKRNKLRNQRLQQVVLDAIHLLGAPASPDSPLISADGKRHFTRFEVYNIVQKYAKKAGLKVTPHGLRATYISSVIKRKGLEAARQLGGHESVETTQRYSRWKIDADDELSLEDL